MNSRIKWELHPYIKKACNILVMLLVPVILFYLMEAFEHDAFAEVRPLAQLYNILLFELIAWILFFFTGNMRTALRITTGTAWVYGIVNHYIMAFRSTPFVPWDIYSIKTAASVAGNYDFTPTSQMLTVCVTFLLVFLLLHFADWRLEQKWYLRLVPAGCLLLVLCTFVNLLWDEDFQSESYLYPFLFTPAYMTKVNGMAVTFAMDLAFVHVEKPDGYSIERAQEILAEYELQTEDAVSTGKLPNIIVIMNEAFSDLSVLGDFTVNEDYMPYIHSLRQGQENTITGNLTVSVCGGNTANSEFEFLTGHSMDFFPVGSIPYQQYITGETPSLATHLKSLGYDTYGMHPYHASGWKRNEIYPLIGFETTYFLPDFTSRHYIRDYISDKTAYEKIITTYENRNSDNPLFIFEVTMQNHGSYSEQYENFTPDIHAEEFESIALDQYLSLLKVSDAQLQKLITYFEQEQEDTMIVFFGDHQPNDAVANQILRLNGVNTADMSVENAQLRYQVPYVIWANFDIDEAMGADEDISFLAAKALQAAGVPTNAYQNFLLEYEADQKESEYQILQYYFMFDYQVEQ